MTEKPVHHLWLPTVAMLILIVALPDLATAAAPSAPANGVVINTPYGGEIMIDPEKFHLYDIPQNRFEELTGIPYEYQKSNLPVEPVSPDGVKSAMATGRVLTVLIEWDNHAANSFAHPAAAYDSILYSTNLYPTGSVNDYYREVSYGAFNITGDVFGWSLMISDYNVGPGPVNTGGYDINEIVTVIDPFVDFSEYDGDGDGYVDALWIIHSGPGQEETHGLYDIWSHAYRGVHIEAGDGVALDRWSVQPERHADGSLISIRVFCHEYGHILTLPDLYDYGGKLDTTTYFTPDDANDHPMVDWDVMGYAGYHIMSYGNTTCPSHFSAWSRTALGWATPEIPDCLEGTFDLYNVELYSSQSVFKIPISDDGREYFLLEYRNPRSAAKFDHLNSDFSAYNPGFTPGRDTLDQGLLITHVDENYSVNVGLPGQAHYGAALEDAGYNPAQPWDGSEFTEWWYPYEFRIGAAFSPDDPGQTVFSPTSVPSSDGHTGPSGLTITTLSMNADYMTLQISRPAAPVFDAVSPVTILGGNSAEVLLSAIDANCTTPALTATSLPPFAVFSDSGNGNGVLICDPLATDGGQYTALIVATDGTLSDTVSIDITVDTPPCFCPCQGDPVCDAVTNVLDVVETVNVAFRSAASTQGPSCPFENTDVDCSGFTNVLDVVRVVNVAFRGADPNVEFCDGCNP